MFTFLTPTYNRAHTLNRLFVSLQNQTSKDFDWLIIDDGSTDTTKDLIEDFKTKADFKISYVYKENGGKHSALIEAKNYLTKPYVIIIDSDDEVLPNCLEIFKKHFDTNPHLTEVRGRCVNPKMDLLGKFKFPKNVGYVDSTWHKMVLKNRNDEELLSCFNLSYYLEAVALPDRLIFIEKFKCFSEGYFWAKIKNAKIRYINEPVRVYHQDSGNSITNNTKFFTGLYDDIVAFKYFLDDNYQYFFWRPKYFLAQYIKLNIASILVGYGFMKSHFLYDKGVNRLISIVLSPVSFLVFLKMKFLDKKYWR
jgi:glycosyltransferase involved in cell wall biosynthesis